MHEEMMARVITKMRCEALRRGMAFSQFQLRECWRRVRPLILDDAMDEDEAVQVAVDLEARVAGHPSPW